MYKLILMNFDGDYVTERDTFATIQDAWEASDDLGSKWFFYPFHFVVTESGKTVADSGLPFASGKGRRVSTVSSAFERCSGLPETQGMDADEYAWFVAFSFS